MTRALIICGILAALAGCTTEVELAKLNTEDDPCLAGNCVPLYRGIIAIYGEPEFEDCIYSESGHYLTRLFYEDTILQLHRQEDSSSCYFTELTEEGP